MLIVCFSLQEPAVPPIVFLTSSASRSLPEDTKESTLEAMASVVTPISILPKPPAFTSSGTSEQQSLVKAGDAVASPDQL